MYYEEAGKPGVTDANYGQLIRNPEWRGWLHDHVHQRGHGPAGTGAGKPPAGAKASAGAAEDEHEQGARPEGAKRGRASGNPGV
jgi:hypothetical protein